MTKNLLQCSGGLSRLSRVALLLFLGIFSATGAMAQVTVSGRVTSGEDQSSIPGVNILIKGSTSGTITDSQGSYSLTLASANDVLVFSFVGFVTQEVVVNGRSTVNVTLATDATQLSEVVVTALGIEKNKSQIGYSGV